MAARSGLKRAVRPAALLLGVSLIAASGTLPAATSAENFAPAAVAAPDRHAARVAAAVLADGGNAIDAAVAVAFVLAVTYPEAGNLGGGGFATVFFEGNSYFLDYRECAPGSATAAMYLDPDGKVIADASTLGAGAAAVPGTVEGLWQLHRRFARRTWSQDLAPAIRLAHEGFQVGRMQQATREARAAELHGRTNFLSYFGALSAGTTFRQRELEATLRRVAAHGSDGFYKGRTAELIIAEMARGHGHISAADLTAYHAIWREPLAGDWAGYHVITAPLPSSGGIALLSLLAMKADLAPAFAGVTLNSPQYVHLLAEIEKRVFADRADYLGDPDFVSAPVQALLAPLYLAERAAEVNTQRRTATSEVRARPEHAPQHHALLDHRRLRQRGSQHLHAER